MKTDFKTLRIFLIWRTLLFILIGVANIAYKPQHSFVNILDMINQTSFLNAGFIFPLANFDGVHYLLIAQRGYITEGRFLPLFPILINIVSKLFFFLKNNLESQFVAALLISNTSFFFSTIIFSKLLKLDYGVEKIKWAVSFLMFFPTAFFFGNIYSESLFLLISLSIFYFARKRNWVVVGILGLLVSITRISGILILPVMIYEFIKEENIKLNKIISWDLIKGLPLLLMPIGLIGYSFFCYYRFGDALYFLHAHGLLANNRSIDSIVFFPQTIFRYIKILILVPFSSYVWWVGFIELAFFLFTLTILFIAWKKKIRFSYLIYAIFLLLLPASSGTFSGLPRYIAVIFPIFIILALIKSDFIKKMILTIFIILLFVFTFIFSRGYYIA